MMREKREEGSDPNQILQVYEKENTYHPKRT
jgi:hypothetical protein